MPNLIIHFHDSDIKVRAELLTEKAPKTTKELMSVLSSAYETTGKHAMYTGKEISVQLAETLFQDSDLGEQVKENLTCFPQPGDILFTYMPKYAWAGIPSQIFDVGIFYGSNARTFFPMGWLPGNLFARVVNEDLEKLAKMGELTLTSGQQKLSLSIEE